MAILYPLYSGIKCPACGSTSRNHDRGPYEVAFPEATADHGCPEVHATSMRRRRFWPRGSRCQPAEMV